MAQPSAPRGRVHWFGHAKLDGGPDRKRVAVVEFEDTAAMQQAVNSGFVDLDFDDDSIAVVLHTPKSGQDG